MFKKSLKLRGEIILNTSPTEIRIQAISGDEWTDFGYWLEATNLMALKAMQRQGWDKKQILDYITKYLNDSLDDIRSKSD